MASYNRLRWGWECFESSKHPLSFGSEREQALPAVGLGRLADNKPPPFEGAQGAAEISRIQSQLGAKCSRRQLAAMSQLIQHAHLGERERTAQQSFLQHSDLPGVKAVETANL